MGEVVQNITMTVSANAPEYIFQISLCSLGMHRLRHKRLLCGFVEIPKNKYEFLNDLAALLSDEIVTRLESLSDK